MADAIWNNNYLLSNLDAQKLYAQSPLTTGVSGSSAYIGIEPSARYNETVLFSGGTTATKSATLVEPITNFNKIGVLYGDDHYGHRYIEADTDYPFVKWITNYAFDGWNTTTTAIGLRELAWSADADKIYAVGGWQKSTVLTATGGWYAGQSGTYGGIIKVIGINRKENV